jgi:hypothetical protein
VMTGNSYSMASSSDSSSMATQTMDSSYGSNYTPPSWSYSAPPSMQTYGSGYNSWGWGGSGYDSCVSREYNFPPTLLPSSQSASFAIYGNWRCRAFSVKTYMATDLISFA